jgi:hypothetical protein
MGPTSGAAYAVGRWWAETNPGALAVVMFPDEGYRYQDTVYDDAWLAERGHLDMRLPVEPVPVDEPAADAGPWTCYDWARRTYPEVMAREPDRASIP